MLLETLTNEGAFLSADEACQLSYDEQELTVKQRHRQWVCSTCLASAGPLICWPINSCFSSIHPCHLLDGLGPTHGMHALQYLVRRLWAFVHSVHLLAKCCFVMQLRDCERPTLLPAGLDALKQLVTDATELRLLTRFLRRLLQVDCNCRPTVQEALADPYFG